MNLQSTVYRVRKKEARESCPVTAVQGAGSLAVLVVLLISVSGCAKERGVEQKHSVLFVSLDTVRADALGCYGSKSARTPTIDGLAGAGVLFEDAMCQAPATGPSFASIMTSKYPQNCGVLHSTMVLPDTQHTLAEEFKARGYRTGAFVSCSILKSKYGFSQGFDVYDETFTRHYSESEVERDAADTTRALTRWLAMEPGAPFFAWVHYFDPHAPYRRRATSQLDEELGTYAFLRKLEESQSLDKLKEALPSIKALYDDEVAYVDRQIGKVLETLERAGMRNDTLIVVAADHGEELFDHHFFHGHFASLYDSVLHTPLIFSFPGKLPQGVRKNGLVENVDIFPTIMAVLGYPPTAGLQGQDLLPAMLGEKEAPIRCGFAQREPYAWMPGGNAYAVRKSAWKLISFASAPDQLFHLAQDPMERNNLAASQKNKYSHFETILEDWLQQGMPAVVVHRESLDPDDLATLKSLGYAR